MIAVVTGGSGFIGQHLVRRLLADGHAVRCLIRPSGGATPPGATRHVVRFDTPASLLNCDALDGADVVFHLAGATKARRERDFQSANVTTTRLLLGAVAARRLRPRFVYASSQAAAGPAPAADRPIDEDDTPRPVEAYGRSKLEAERVVESFSDHVPTTIVRPCAVFGPRDRDFLTLFRFAERGFVAYPGTATHWMSLLYVQDVVEGLVLAALSDAAILRCYFLSSSRPVQWRTLGEHVANAIGRDVRHVDVSGALVRTASLAGSLVGRLTGHNSIANADKAALARHHFWVCSAQRARRELAFNESHSLPDAVRETYLWYRQNGWLGGSRGASSRSVVA
jgi:dihydroflavonol-4-reductase